MKTIPQPLLGQRIRDARKSRLLTLEELGRRVGISNQALSAIERGKKNPSKQTLMGLSRELSTSFGMKWLDARLAEEPDDTTLELEEHFRLSSRENLREDFNEFLDFKFGSTQLSEIGDIVSGMRKVSLIAKITSDGTIEKLSGNDSLFIPARMSRPRKKGYGVVIESTMFTDDLIGLGDVLIVNKEADVLTGKVVLADVRGSLFIRRISLKGRMVTMIPMQPDRKPHQVSLKDVRCLGEVIGVIRFIE